MKKIAFFVATAAVVLAAGLSAQAYGWADVYCDIAAEEGLIQNGLNLGSGRATRGEFCGLVYNAMNKKTGLEPSDNNIYSDTDSREISALSEIGIINGKGEGKFCPDDSLTREEAATIIARAADIIGINGGGLTVPDYEDAEKISDWAKDGIERVVTIGIMEGRSSKEFAPKAEYSVGEAVTTVLRLYCSTPVYKDDTVKTELTDGVYVYKNSAATWIEADDRVIMCTDRFDGEYVCTGVLGDGRRAAAVSQKENYVASTRGFQVIDRKCRVYDLSDGRQIYRTFDTAHKFLGDLLLTYTTSEQSGNAAQGQNWYSRSYNSLVYDIKNGGKPLSRWYEFDGGDVTLIAMENEVLIYHGNEAVKTVAGSCIPPTDDIYDDSGKPEYTNYFEVKDNGEKKAYDKDGNLIYTYPENEEYNTITGKFEFEALGKKYEAETPFDEFNEALSDEVSLAITADKIRVLYGGNEVLSFDNTDVRNVMLMIEAGVLAVEDTADAEDTHYYDDNITLYNILNGAKRATLPQKGTIAAYCGNNIFIHHSDDAYSRNWAYDIDGRLKLADVKGHFCDPAEGWYKDYKTIPQSRMEYYTAEDGLHRCEDFSLVVSGDIITMDERYIEAEVGDDIVVYDYNGNVVITTDEELYYHETPGGRRLFRSGITWYNGGRNSDHIKLFDYETGELLIERDGKLAMNDAGAMSYDAIGDNYVFFSAPGAIVNYENEIVYEGGTMYPVMFDGELYILGSWGEPADAVKLFRPDNLEVVKVFSRDILPYGGQLFNRSEYTDDEGNLWEMQDLILTCTPAE